MTKPNLDHPTFPLVKARFPDAVLLATEFRSQATLVVEPQDLHAVLSFLRHDADCDYNFLADITAVDYLHTDPKKAEKADWDPHIELVYHLSSIRYKHTLVLKVKLDRWNNGREGELPVVPSVAGIWRTADWHEREVFDLSGVEFSGHPDLRRILCPEDWEGYPLRKDYELPKEYHGIRGR